LTKSSNFSLPVLLIIGQVAIVMHCNLKPPVVPVVLCFNHKAALTQTHSATLYQILAQPDNPRLSYCHLTLFNLSTSCHLGF